MAARSDAEGMQSARWKQHLAGGIRGGEGVEAFRRLLGLRTPQVVVLARKLLSILELQERSLNTARTRPTERTVGAFKPAESLELNETQQILAEIWQEMLGIPQVGLEDNFFELGGHSLLGTGILSRVRLKLDVALTLRTLFEAPTIRQLSEIVDTMRWARTMPAEGASGNEEEREAIEI
jgi:hypothetical protein